MKMSYISGSVLVALLSFFIQVTSVFAHGEDRPGPNGGIIRMPGAFHTELVKKTDQKFKVYLLDMEWKNPTVNASTLEATLEVGTKKTQAVCETKIAYFECSIPKGMNLSKGTLTIQASRENSPGGPAIYKLPLHAMKHE